MTDEQLTNAAQLRSLERHISFAQAASELRTIEAILAEGPIPAQLETDRDIDRASRLKAAEHSTTFARGLAIVRAEQRAKGATQPAAVSAHVARTAPADRANLPTSEAPLAGAQLFPAEKHPEPAPPRVAQAKADTRESLFRKVARLLPGGRGSMTPAGFKASTLGQLETIRSSKLTPRQQAAYSEFVRVGNPAGYGVIAALANACGEQREAGAESFSANAIARIKEEISALRTCSDGGPLEAA